ncbi:MAG TPA: hypothetical protein VGP08_07565 [Pyrinomonadaceae bacterium]|jgi:hypothetical protein|nr:hypothetical protein [Pyrinomonadaceae bacterium]
MTNVKCPRCGLFNWPSDEVCERCAEPLAAADASVPAPAAQECAPEREERTNQPEERAPEREESAFASARPDFPGLTFGGDLTSGSRTWKPVLAAVVAALLVGAGLVVYKISVDLRRPGTVVSTLRKRLVGTSMDESTRYTLLSYLAQPGIAGTGVSEQVLGHVRLELLQVSDREVYFSAPAPSLSGETFEAVVARLVIDPKRVVVAQDDLGGRMRLGDYSLLRTTEKSFFFKTPMENVKFDTATVLKFPFGPATYTLDMREMSDFIQNKNIFGGRINVLTGQREGGLPVVFANHGALVARPGESSLTRFVGELTRDIPADGAGAREVRVQRVLDFVTREIKYDQREATYNFELLKRPNEVLMSRESDCSNKAILLGSLLEQLGEDYLFVYLPHHITVAVPQGRFPAANGLTLEWEGKTWVIAEGTAPGFRIGVDRLADEEQFKQFQFVQRPSERDVIFDLATGRRLSFQ